MLNTTINTVVVGSPYLDINIWYFIAAIGLLLLLISNITTREQNNALWAILCPFFTFPSAYFALQMCTNKVSQTFYNGTWQVQIQQTVYHPEWLAFIFGIVFVCSFVNVWWILFGKQKNVEKTKKDELLVEQI